MEFAFLDLKEWAKAIIPSVLPASAATAVHHQCGRRGHQQQAHRGHCQQERRVQHKQRKRRATYYGAVQEAWRKTQSRIEKAVLAGEASLQNAVLPGKAAKSPFSSRQMFDFWEPLFTASSCEVNAPEPKATPTALWSLWWLVTLTGVRMSKVPNTRSGKEVWMIWAGC